jgi:tRNA (uracil-5-)-methyltransferase TRM9
MELSTAQQLAALNRRFYNEHAENFADSRPRLAPGVQQVLVRVPAGARVLEVGCGDGKVGRALARAGVSEYVGLDASRAMLQRAQRYTMNEAAVASVFRPPSFAFQLADLTTPAWPDAVAGQSFDWVLAFAVFHHLPGYDLRVGVLQRIAEHLAPGGRIAFSNWQLTRSARMLQRVVPWSAAGLSDENVEPGDYLLSWERNDRHGLRYVHVIDGQEAHSLTAAAGLRILETFSADGETGDLSEYCVLEHAH